MTSFCGIEDGWWAICERPVDWSATGDFWSGAGTVAAAVAVIVTAWKAKNALDDWKAQKLSERKIQQAERILEAAYKARDALDYVRRPKLSEFEEEAAHAQLLKRPLASRIGEGSVQRGLVSQARINRLDSVQQQQDELLHCRPMAKAFFGNDLYNAVTLLHSQFANIREMLNVNRSIEVESEPGSINAALSKVLKDEERRKKLTERTESSVAVIEAQCLLVLNPTFAKYDSM